MTGLIKMGAIFLTEKVIHTHTPPPSSAPLGSLPQAIPCGQFLIYAPHRLYVHVSTLLLLPSPPHWRPEQQHTIPTVLHLAVRQLQTSTTGPTSFFLMLWCMRGVDQLHTAHGRIRPAAYFYKHHLTGSQPCSFVHVLSTVTCKLQRQS